MRILLINSHPQDLLCALEKAGHAVSAAENGVAADRKVRSVDYGVIVLDRGSVDDGDLSLVKEWRRRGISAYILVLATQLTLKDKVSVFDAGADGYVLPPNPHEQLMARVRALMRRDDHQAKETILRIFDLEIDTAYRMIKRAGKSIRLSRREYDVLQYLALHRGKPVSRAMILNDVYRINTSENSNIVNVYISYLRFKIDEGFALPLILTIRGKGYMLRGGSDHEQVPFPITLESATVRHARSPSNPRNQHASVAEPGGAVPA